MANHRVQRLAGEIQKETAAILSRDVKDPRLGMVSVTGVEIAPDGCSCHIHISPMLPEGSDLNGVRAALESAKGYIRRELGLRLKTRIIPELYFQVDDNIAYAIRMQQLIMDQVSADEEAAQGRLPEDPDKYVKPL